MSRLKERYYITAGLLLLAFIYLHFHAAEIHESASRFVRGKNGQFRLSNTASLQLPTTYEGTAKRIKKLSLYRNSAFDYQGVKKHSEFKDALGTIGRFLSLTSFIVFGPQQSINLDMNHCSDMIVYNKTIPITSKKGLDTPLREVLLRIIRDIDGERDPYLQEMKPYFNTQIRLQVLHDVVDKHWFRMAGSSVFLKEYGYHMMVSRLAYSPDCLRNNPKFSFAYAQLFDTNWNEVKDVHLVVPTNDIKGKRFFKDGGDTFTIMQYPSVLPIPFFHDYDDAGMKYLGPEDARLILVRNKAGYEEPLLVFNAYHQKPTLLDDDEDDHVHMQLKGFRSIWVGWPWQFQRGKLNTDGVQNNDFDSRIYNKVHELQIKNIPRVTNQKNWTPFLSRSLRKSHGYDKEILLVYRWSHLQILQCDIDSPDGKCGFLYSQEEDLKITSKIGPLRGGTPLVSVNKILREYSADLEASLIPEGTEVWLSFARAHLGKCGCGSNFYRPNLAVLIKSAVKVPGSDETKDVFLLSYISSFVSLGIPIIPWDAFKPLDLCSGTNALIPNGISNWKLRTVTESDGVRRFDDVLTLSLSVSDSTVDIVHLKGLLDILANSGDKPFDLNHHSKATDGETEDRGNDKIVCAMEASTGFCVAYGQEIELRQKIGKEDEEDFVFDQYDDSLEQYREALEQAGYSL